MFLDACVLRFLFVMIMRDGAGTIGWPVDVNEETVMEDWREDESVGLRKGRYRTQLACFGDAPRWRVYELDVIREVMAGAGWRVTSVWGIRGVKNPTKRGRDPRDSRYFSRA